MENCHQFGDYLTDKKGTECEQPVNYVVILFVISFSAVY